MSTPPSSAAASYDFFTPEVIGEPMPMLARLRSESPVYFSPQLQGWVLTRYQDVNTALRSPGLDSAMLLGMLGRFPPEVQQELTPLRNSVTLWMGHTNTKDHQRFQHILKKYFIPSTMDALRPRIQQLTDELLDAVQARGEMDVVKDLAYPLPANVIAEVLGIPTKDRDMLVRWSRDVLALFQTPDLDMMRRSQKSVLEMQEYMRPIVADRRGNPRKDIISVLVAAQEEGSVYSEDEIVANCVMLLFGGHETVANLLSTGVLHLLQHPDQMAKLKADPGLVHSAIEEMARYDGPADMLLRLTREPLTLGQTQIPAGNLVFLLTGAANRDPEAFTEPERFDITRKQNRHLGFGIGSFYCLGAALARVEMDVCLTTLLRRMPNLQPRFDKPDWMPLPPLRRRLESLRVGF
jgi:cytochrome P450